jgi:hypothetical protein
MSNEMNLFPLLGLAAGAGMLVFGLFQRHRAYSVTSAPLRPAGGLVPGVPQVISGRVSAPVELKAPVSGRSCAFFLAEIDTARFVQNGRGGASVRWVPSEDLPYGFFFVDDSFGRALVCPTCGSLDLRRLSERDGSFVPAEGDRRTKETVILQGEEVTVLGSLFWVMSGLIPRFRCRPGVWSCCWRWRRTPPGPRYPASTAAAFPWWPTSPIPTMSPGRAPPPLPIYGEAWPWRWSRPGSSSSLSCPQAKGPPSKKVFRPID